MPHLQLWDVVIALKETTRVTPEIETGSEIHRTAHRWIDISVALCALVVSITSLGIAVHHGRTMTRLVAANSWPILEFTSGRRDPQGQDIISLSVSNKGVGPAKVETVEVSWEGRPLRTNRELLEACCDLPRTAPALPQMQSNSLQGTMLRPGEVRSFLVVPRMPESEAVWARLLRARADISVRACYCSVFDECWVSDLQTLHPESVKRCAAPKVDFVS
jgi:hypothetical protein